MHDNQQTCVLIIDHEDFLEGILTLGDIQRKGFETTGEACGSPRGDSTISDVCAPEMLLLFLMNLCIKNSYLI